MGLKKLIKYGGAIFFIKVIFDTVNIVFVKILYRLKFFKKSVQYSVVDLLLKSRENIKIDISSDEILITETPSDHKFALRKNTSDAAVYLEIYKEAEYNFLIDLIREKGISIKTIVDVGSNIGISILYFLNEYPSSKVFAIEADKSNYNQLKRNLQLNNLTNVVSINAGLWSNDSMLSIKSDFRGGSNWALAVEQDIKGEVRGISPATFINEYKIREIDLLKMDIEGCERILFEDPSKCDYLELVKVVCIEIHEEVNSFATVANTLIDYGFKLDFKNDVLIGFKE